MEFKIVFRCKNSAEMPVSQTMGKCGLTHLDRARTETKNASLLASDIHESILFLSSYEYSIEIDELTARKSGHFINSYEVEVVVPPKHLNNWVVESLYQTRDTEKDYDYAVFFQYTVNEKAVLTAWESAGFPLDWTSK